MNWARKSRLLRFWRKFKYLSNDHILFDFSSLLRHAMRQKHLPTFLHFLLCHRPSALLWHYYFGRSQKLSNLPNWTRGCTRPGGRVAIEVKLLMRYLGASRESQGPKRPPKVIDLLSSPFLVLFRRGKLSCALPFILEGDWVNLFSDPFRRSFFTILTLE